jgi:HTH-type transcriptional regulator, sugar sensing transcriptional regulator
MELIELLKKWGLEEKEAKVYLALLKLREATATLIAEKTNLDRTLIYQLTNKLIEKGMVSYIIKNNVRYFSAANPKKILENLREKQKEVEKAMPGLLELVNTKEEATKVEIYRGKEGLKTVLNDILRIGKDYVVFGEEGRFQEVLPIDIHQFLMQIVKKKIHEKVLVREDWRGKAVKSKNSEFRYLPKKMISPSSTIIYGNKVCITVWTPPFYAILIENKEVAESYGAYFEALWKIAKR